MAIEKVDLPMKNIVIVYSCVNVYQRVTPLTKWIITYPLVI